ncbi:MAG: hypothetical protein AAGA87_08380 [Pseudomonadota bacterium]
MRPLFLALLLSGCSSIVPGTVARLATYDPLTADPAGFAVVVDLPEGLGLTTENWLSLTAARGDETVGDRFRLVRDGEVWRIDPARLDALRALQAQAREWESEDPDGTSGSLGVSVEGCRVGDGPAEDATLTVHLRTEANAPLRPLLRNASVEDILAAAGVDILPPCNPV